jgi:sporulation protein YlmC with PRC-barrel domain
MPDGAHSDQPRVVDAGLQLLDRQLLDRDGAACGKVDDVELEEGSDGQLYATAILCGPGALLQRRGRTRLGGWLRRFALASYPWTADPGRIPFEHVEVLGDHVEIDLAREDVATFAVERWVRDHVIRHIPGSASRADG